MQAMSGSDAQALQDAINACQSVGEAENVCRGAQRQVAQALVLDAAIVGDNSWELRVVVADAERWIEENTSTAGMVQERVDQARQRMHSLDELQVLLREAMQGRDLNALSRAVHRAELLRVSDKMLRMPRLRVKQLRALDMLTEAARLQDLKALQDATCYSESVTLDEDGQEAYAIALMCIDLQEAMQGNDPAPLRSAIERIGDAGIVDADVLQLAQQRLRDLLVTCDAGHQVLKSDLDSAWVCHGCYADSSKALERFRCEECDVDFCYYCKEWRIKKQLDAEQKSEQVVALSRSTSGTKRRARLAFDLVLDMPFLSGDQSSQRRWFEERAARLTSISASFYWELERDETWYPLGKEVSRRLTEAWTHGQEQMQYRTRSQQEYLFDLNAMRETCRRTGKWRNMRCVVWEIELDLGWVVMEVDLSRLLHAHTLRGVKTFGYTSRDTDYVVDTCKMIQTNKSTGTERRLRKVPSSKVSHRMNRHHLRDAFEDAFPDWATSIKQWLAMRWPWQAVDDCSIDADQFIEFGLAEEMATCISGLRNGAAAPCLTGSILESIVWFDYFDTDKGGFLTTAQVIDGLLKDARWRWGRAGAEDALRALRAVFNMGLADCVGKREFIVAGGLADELVLMLNSELASVDDWIIETKDTHWEGQECAICFCPIDKDDVGRHMRCGCWIHFECLGHGLRVQIRERQVGDEAMSTCPAGCGRPLGRVIPPGVVQRAVGEDFFQRYLDVRVELQWEKEAVDSGQLVAECPSCRFLVMCNETDEMYSVKCLRGSCSVDRFCAYCSRTGHWPLTCEEQQQALATQELIPRVRGKIEEALGEALIRNCTGCGVPTERINACCHMTCSQCRAQFSWVCGAPYLDCRRNHSCMNNSIYLHSMPQLASLLQERGLPCSDENGSDLFLELRCLYLLSFVKREVGEEAWDCTRESCPEILSDVIRSSWSIPWDEVGNLRRLGELLPFAFPAEAPAAALRADDDDALSDASSDGTLADVGG
eukprot:TRINITY_DN14102_c0_g1_i1.p1 TRINITY_DN14102_c0_g1~~TRINITY_DN14102_c0_g1_i1.p1  ORF type:complete len:996 (-),score=153.81 TRINITY_DN14102_c0_g1_i1:14-3001(-)